MYKPLLLITFLLTLHLYSNAQPGKSKADPVSPKIKFEKTEYDFGRVIEGTVIEYDFGYSNDGIEPLIIYDTHGTCHCIDTQISKEPLPKRGRAIIKVKFDSNDRPGIQEKTIFVNSNASDKQVKLRIKGEVIAKN